MWMRMKTETIMMTTKSKPLAAGWEEVEKSDLVNTQFAAKERDKRKQEIREEVYESVMGNASGVDTNTTLEGFDRLGIN